MANRELFQKLYDQITAQPDGLKMTEWVDHDTLGEVFINPITLKEGNRSCGTTRCAFGWVSFFEVGPDADPVAWAEDELATLVADGKVDDWHADHYSATTLVGAHLLQIDPDEAEELFLHTSNTEAVEKIRGYADGIFE